MALFAGIARSLGACLYWGALFAGAPSAFGAPTGAMFSGRVLFSAAAPVVKPLPVFKNRNFCGPQVINETLITNYEGGVKNAVVLLRLAGVGRRAQSELTKRAVLDNRKCLFVPHIQVVPVGAEIFLKNSDPILHTVHARLGRETLFNVGLPKWRQVTKRLDRPGVIRIDCDVLHTWMSAAIVVSDTPYVAISDERGRFAIAGLPAGDFEAEIWHERFGTRKQKLTLKETEPTNLDIIYAAYNP